MSWVGISGGWLLCSRPWTHNRYGFSLALQWHFCVLQVQGSSQGGTVFLGGLLLKVLAFMLISHLDSLADSSNFLISRTAALCL